MVGAIKSIQHLETIARLLDEVPNLRLNLFCAPALLNRRKMDERVRAGMFGWEGTRYECITWTDELAEKLIASGLAKGYDPLFMPPSFYYDEELEEACKKLGVRLFSNNPPKDDRIYVYCPVYTLDYHPVFRVDNLKEHTGGFDLL